MKQEKINLVLVAQAFVLALPSLAMLGFVVPKGLARGLLDIPLVFAEAIIIIVPAFISLGLVMLNKKSQQKGIALLSRLAIIAQVVYYVLLYTMFIAVL